MGTPFEKTRTPLQLWFYAIHTFTTTRHGVSAKEVPNQRVVTLKPIVLANVRPGGQVHTDDLRSYAGLHTVGYRHMTVNHGAGEYVGFAGARVNGIENFWRHLKCSINGTHVSVSPKHLGRYTKEFEYRFNRRNDAASMLPELLSAFLPLPSKSD